LKTLKEKHANLCAVIGEAETKRLLHSWYDRAIKRAEKRKSTPADPFDAKEFCNKVLTDLRNLTGITYRLTDVTKASILARRNEGFSFKDFQKVHEIKTLDWLEDPIRRKYLHPSTLYRPTKFDKYITQFDMKRLDEKRKDKKKKIKQTEIKESEKDMTPEEAEKFKKRTKEILAKLKNKKRKSKNEQS